MNTTASALVVTLLFAGCAASQAPRRDQRLNATPAHNAQPAKAQASEPKRITAPPQRGGHHQNPAGRPVPERPPHRTSTPPHPQLAGWPVPNTQVFLPRTARAGSTIEGRAPTGGRVEAFGKDVPVRADGRFSLRIPADASGTLKVRVFRPGTTMVPLRVDITE